MCAPIASYYRLSIQRNVGDVYAIVQAVKAIPYHLEANDDNAKEYHRYCPYVKRKYGSQYQAAKFDYRSPPQHPNFLSETAMKIILDIFAEFKIDTPAFLEKVSMGRISNHNEAIHSVLFRIVRKTETVRNEVMRLGAALAVISYNDGFIGIGKVFETIGITPGHYLEMHLRKLDNTRIEYRQYIIRNQQRRFARKQRRG